MIGYDEYIGQTNKERNDSNMNKKGIILYLPDGLIKEIEEYQQANYISTRNAAILHLITKSLNISTTTKKGEQKNG